MWTPVTPEEDLKNGYCVPGSVAIRSDGHYDMATRLSDQACKRAGVCRKGTHKYTEIMPGIFAAFCAHGICLAFFFMSNHESPETLFSFLMQRRKVPPNALIADNSCLVQHFSLNREPHYFKDTEFYIDGFHNQGNHVGCSTGYTIALFRYFDVINTEVAEQFFSILDRIVTPVAFMRVENATLFVRLFVAFQNEKRNKYWSSPDDETRRRLAELNTLLTGLISLA